MIPATRTRRFFGRVDVLLKLDEILVSDSGAFSLQSVALHGAPGVGKSSIASSYADKRFSDRSYDVVLWVCSEKEASMRQSMTDVALQLTFPGAQPHTHDENQIIVREWFRTTGMCKNIGDYSELRY